MRPLLRLAALRLINFAFHRGFIGVLWHGNTPSQLNLGQEFA